MVSSITFRSATQQDGAYIADHLRPADVLEIWAAHRQTPQEAVKQCFQLSNCTCVLVDNIPTIIFGCADYDGFGVPWLLATDDINKIKVQFILKSQDIIKPWKQKYSLLTNYVHSSNKLSIRWLKWLGFLFQEKVIFNDEYFYRFEMRCK